MNAQDTVVGHLDLAEQAGLVAAAHYIAAAAPLLRPTAGSLPMSVRITNAGAWGWWADEHGYRYVDRHPRTGEPWPPVPSAWVELFHRFASDHREPIAHLVWYGPGAKLGEHRDKTERDLAGSIVTISLGSPARWRVRDEDGVLTTATLYSGDVTLLEGPTRHLLHQVDRIDPELDLLHPSPLDCPGRLAISLRSGAGG